MTTKSAAADGVTSWEIENVAGQRRYERNQSVCADFPNLKTDAFGLHHPKEEAEPGMVHYVCG